MKHLILIISCLILIGCDQTLDLIDTLIQKNLTLITKVDQFNEKYNSTELIIEAGILDPSIDNQNADFEEILSFIKEEDKLCEGIADSDVELPDSLDELRDSFDPHSTEGRIQCSVAKGLAKIAFKKACEHSEDELLKMSEDIFEKKSKYKNHKLDKGEIKQNIQNLTQHCA